MALCQVPLSIPAFYVYTIAHNLAMDQRLNPDPSLEISVSRDLFQNPPITQDARKVPPLAYNWITGCVLLPSL